MVVKKLAAEEAADQARRSVTEVREKKGGGVTWTVMLTHACPCASHAFPPEVEASLLSALQ